MIGLSRRCRPLAALACGAMAIVAPPLAAQVENPQSQESIHVKPFDLPADSELLSAETRAGIARRKALFAQGYAICTPKTTMTGKEIRACEALAYAPILAEVRKFYDVKIEAATIAGIPTEIVTPSSGISPANRYRVLINVHGGGFVFGARVVGELEAMPIAASGKYRVVAVDYRLAPDHHFPAASEDVVAVYQDLLKSYAPSEIGFYGCSAGGWIIGQSMSLIAKRKLPKPGAIAIQCAPPLSLGGDSNVIAAALDGVPPHKPSLTEFYFQGVSPTDPMAYPADFDEQLKHFPPTLTMTSTRDIEMSPSLIMHYRLTRLGVPAELQVFEGLRHGEYVLNPYIPETRVATKMVTDFFDRWLSRPGKRNARR